MRKQNKIYLLLLSSIFILSGCLVRTYQVTKDRVDQDLTAGNRGYLKGQAPGGALEETKKSTRTVQVIEVELNPPIKFEKKPKAKPQEETPVAKTEDKQIWGNRGFITQGQTPQIIEPGSTPVNLEKYTVQKGDTLQKIAKKFYRTTKKWKKIYEANKDVLKGPNKIYPGQVIDIPVESLKETKENLK